jgi:ABC-type oligopeptide transport system ATPase subunit
VQSIAGRIAVMQHGRIVEIGRDIFDAPTHPYTRLLLEARLSADPREVRARLGKPSHAEAEDGKSPKPADVPAGCHEDSAEANAAGRA